MTSSNNNLDLKYELFCKWLQANQQIPLESLPNPGPVLEHQNSQNQLATEDEVSSFATNDSDSDVFLDTESDFPSIILNEIDDGISLAVKNNPRPVEESMNCLRADTPSQLSVSDFDCSSSDVTVNSRMSPICDASNGQIKPKAKHKKGRAPPVPTPNENDFNQTNSDDSLSLEQGQQTSDHDTALQTNSHRETDI